MDTYSKALQVITIFKQEMPKYKKIILACQCLAKLDITNTSEATKNYIDDHLYKANRILVQYPIRDWEDYRLISDMHQNKMLKSFKRLCEMLISDK